MDCQPVEIMGVRVMAIDQHRLVDQVLAWVKEGVQHTVTYVNAHCLNLAIDNSLYREQLNRTDLIYVDGIGAVWAGRMHGARGMHKVTGRNWITELCQKGEKVHLRMYLLGGAPGVSDQAGQVLTQRYPQLSICGCADGYFQAKSEEQVLAEINANHTEVLLIGMGAPTQENWVTTNQPYIQAYVCWSVGALFDYLAGVEKPVPKWLERVGLEWAWRLKENPKGKWKRYCLGIPRFVGRVTWQWLSNRTTHA
jgi:N-acetylglucosaminyldiphosphoundecaprenol N-acetyl-beta-D-mannosaminyltransferase